MPGTTDREISPMPESFVRVGQSLGERATIALAMSRVAVIGVGGVGSWCAEALARTGVGSILIVDPDRIVPSNINRQLIATTKTVGEQKVSVLERRLLEINPGLHIEAAPRRYSRESAETFALEKYDCVVDAIDSVEDKADLILHVDALDRVRLFSSMGAALRSDPFSVDKAEFRKVEGDALARSLRRRFRELGMFPKSKFQCVYSHERPSSAQDALPSSERRAYGSLVQVSAVFGFALAGLVVDALTRRTD